MAYVEPSSTEHSLFTGSYAFIETSTPRKRGDNAILLSPVMKESRPINQCLQFWYHMYGSSVGALQVKYHI